MFSTMADPTKLSFICKLDWIFLFSKSITSVLLFKKNPTMIYYFCWVTVIYMHTHTQIYIYIYKNNLLFFRYSAQHQELEPCILFKVLKSYKIVDKNFDKNGFQLQTLSPCYCQFTQLSDVQFASFSKLNSFMLKKFSH